MAATLLIASLDTRTADRARVRAVGTPSSPFPGPVKCAFYANAVLKARRVPLVRTAPRRAAPRSLSSTVYSAGKDFKLRTSEVSIQNGRRELGRIGWTRAKILARYPILF